MDYSTANVTLTISSCSLSLTNIDTGHIIAKHDMPRISFASGGDTVKSIHIDIYCISSFVHFISLFLYMYEIKLHTIYSKNSQYSY